MEQIVKHSAGGIVLNPKTQKILITKKLSKNEFTAKIIKSLLALFHIQPETVITRFKGGFTKGKIEEGHTKAFTACKEIQEEGGINPRDFIFEKKLGTFTKQKEYGLKEVEMFLYTLHKEYPELHPSDPRHIAAFMDMEKVPDSLQSKNEKRFLKSVQKEIKEVLNKYNEIHTIPREETADIMQEKKVSLAITDKNGL